VQLQHAALLLGGEGRLLEAAPQVVHPAQPARLAAALKALHLGLDAAPVLAAVLLQASGKGVGAQSV
jgi:hypothetical protein